MSSISANNNCAFTGRLGNEPEVRILQDGKKIISFSIAVDRSYKNKNGERKVKTNWIRCVAFHPISKLVEACHTHKGNKVHIIGQLENEKYVTANGENRDSYSIWIAAFEKLTGDKKTDGNSEQQTSGESNSFNQTTQQMYEEQMANQAEEDLPF